MGASTVKPPASPARQALSLLLRIGISAALLYLLWRKPSVKLACGQLTPSAIWWLAGGIALYCGGMVINARKWQVLLEVTGHPVPLRVLMRMTFAGMFANLFLPTAVGGDVARIGLLGAHGVPVALATLSVFMQRVTGFVALLVIGLGGLLGSGKLSEPAPRGVFLGLSAMLLVLVVAFVLGWFCDRRLDVIERLPGGLARPLRKFGEGLRSLGGSPRALGQVMALSLAFQLWQVLVGAWLAAAAHCHAGAVNYFWLVPVTAVASMVPVGLGGVGTREHFANTVLRPLLGDAGVVWQVLWDAMVVLSSLPGGLLLLAGLGAPEANSTPDQEPTPRAAQPSAQ